MTSSLPLANKNAGGFNHWSTWYLRGVSGNRQLIGLMGEARTTTILPFVAQYRDHDPSYWADVEGGIGKYRLAMVGLEKDCATFAYTLFADGSYQAVNLLFPSEDDPQTFVIVASGKSYNPTSTVVANSVCTDVLTGRDVLWVDTETQQTYVKTYCRSDSSQ